MTSGEEEERVRRDLRSAVAAWSVLDYEAFDGLTYADLDAGYETYAAVTEAFAAYDDVLDSSLP